MFLHAQAFQQKLNLILFSVKDIRFHFESDYYIISKRYMEYL